MRSLALLTPLSLALMVSLGSAQQTAPAKGPPLALALEAAQTAVNTCTANAAKASTAVVDSAGVVLVLLRADGASPQSVEFSTKKAYTANAMKETTSEVQQKMKTDPTLAAKLSADPNMRPNPGGNEVIGAIGVGGSTTLNGVNGGERDAICARAGIDKIKDRLK
jgi:uncharacterized protein GlcG (DUF336 family)